VGQYKQYLEATLNEKRNAITADAAKVVASTIERLTQIHEELNTLVSNSAQQPLNEQILQTYVKELTAMRNKATSLLQVAALAFPGFFNSKFSNAFELVSHIRRNKKLVKVRYK